MKRHGSSIVFGESATVRQRWSIYSFGSLVLRLLSSGSGARALWVGLGGQPAGVCGCAVTRQRSSIVGREAELSSRGSRAVRFWQR